MGCLTGNYLLLRGDYESKDIVELMRRTFRFVADFEGEIPGAAPQDCGNWLLHDLPMPDTRHANTSPRYSTASRRTTLYILNAMTDA